MPITSDLQGKNYTLGRGRLFFERYPNNVDITNDLRGEGERYIGNTPAFNITSTAENLEHFDSDSGVRVKDDSVQLSNDRSGTFTTDNIDSENMALLFLGEVSARVQASAVGVIDTLTGYQKRFLQLGMSSSNPTGVRKISNVVVKKGVAFGDTVAPANNYQIDEDLGRIYILPNSPDIADATPLQITFDVAASTREQVVSSSNAIYGALRYVAENPKGRNRDFYLPYVKLAPDGDFEIKAESDWVVAGFTFEVLQKGSLQGLYIDGRAA